MSASRFAAISPVAFTRLYWCMRLGIAFIWLWTAWVSWFIYPHAQSVLVGVYTAVIMIALPEFVVHPFGPIVKNIAVLLCLAMLALADRNALAKK